MIVREFRFLNRIVLNFNYPKGGSTRSPKLVEAHGPAAQQVRRPALHLPDARPAERELETPVLEQMAHLAEQCGDAAAATPPRQNVLSRSWAETRRSPAT